MAPRREQSAVELTTKKTVNGNALAGSRNGRVRSRHRSASRVNFRRIRVLTRRFLSRHKRLAAVAAAIVAIGVVAIALSGIFGGKSIRSTGPAATPTPLPHYSCTGGQRNTPGGPDPWGGCWPGPGNTGVPPGTVLRSVPQDVSSGKGWTWNVADDAIYITGCHVVLDSLNVHGAVYLRNGNGTQSAATPCVTIKNSKINGFVDVNDYCLVSQCGPLVMTDDEIAIPQGSDRSSLLYSNWFAWRINSHGGHGTLACSGHCEVYDSWIHGFYLEQAFHYNAVGSNGDGTGPFIIDHNYLSCGDFWAKDPDTDGSAGCSADLGLYGDFSPIANISISRNYFAPAAPTETYTSNYQPGYCINTNNPQIGKAYPNATNEVVTDNVFARGYDGKCGTYGPVSSWRSGNGNIWKGNTWDNGMPLNVDSSSGN